MQRQELLEKLREENRILSALLEQQQERIAKQADGEAADARAAEALHLQQAEIKALKTELQDLEGALQQQRKAQEQLREETEKREKESKAEMERQAQLNEQRRVDELFMAEKLREIEEKLQQACSLQLASPYSQFIEQDNEAERLRLHNEAQLQQAKERQQAELERAQQENAAQLRKQQQELESQQREKLQSEAAANERKKAELLQALQAKEAQARQQAAELKGHDKNLLAHGIDLGKLGPKNERQQAVAKAFKWAWDAYKRCAWGQDELSPISCRGAHSLTRHPVNSPQEASGSGSA